MSVNSVKYHNSCHGLNCLEVFSIYVCLVTLFIVIKVRFFCFKIQYSQIINWSVKDFLITRQLFLGYRWFKEINNFIGYPKGSFRQPGVRLICLLGTLYIYWNFIYLLDINIYANICIQKIPYTGDKASLDRCR